MATKTTYRAFAAREIGLFHSSTATSNSTTSVLEDATWPVFTSLAQEDFYRDMFLFRPNASTASDKVRIIKTYTPSSGQLTPDKAWSVSPYLTSGETYEIHGVIEPNTTLSQLINDALKRCFVVVEFTLTPTDDYKRQSLASAAVWLTNPKWVRAVAYLTANELTNYNRNTLDPFVQHPIGGHAETVGGVTYLVHPDWTFDGTETLYVRAIKPAYYHCKATGGVYGGQSGLNLETDEAPPEVTVEWLGFATLVEAWRKYGQLLEVTANQRLLRDEAKAAAMFDYHTRKNFKLPPLEFKELIALGPRY